MTSECRSQDRSRTTPASEHGRASGRFERYAPALGWGVLLLAVLLALAPRPAECRPTIPDGFVDQLIMGNLFFPTGLTFLPDGRLIVIERKGWLRLIVDGKLGAIDPAATVDSLAGEFFEQGLLGVAVDPGWPTRPYLYMYYCAVDSTMRISRFRVNGDLNSPTSVDLSIDLGSRYELFRDLPDKNESHNGGTIRFGPDGMLYVALADDWNRCAAQDTVSFRGVMLRLRVDQLPDGPGGPPAKSLLTPPDNPFVWHANPNARLVWAMGLRNPFRFHIDSQGGAIYIADVGESAYEEIDEIDAPGVDFGWPFYEGPQFHGGVCPPMAGAQFRAPIYFYDRTNDDLASIITAGVYRGVGCANCNFPAEYEGDFFFSDWYIGHLRRMKRVDGQWQIAPPVPGQPNALDWGQGFDSVSDYAVGPDGALWYCYSADGNYNGEIHRIAYAPPATASVPRSPRDGVVFSAPTPTPARGATKLYYTLPRASRVELSIFDVTGRRVRRLLAPSMVNAGRYGVTWDARSEAGFDAPSGVYLVRLTVDGVSYSQHLPLFR